jgi:hypothetical protein
VKKGEGGRAIAAPAVHTSHLPATVPAAVLRPWAAPGWRRQPTVNLAWRPTRQLAATGCWACGVVEALRPSFENDQGGPYCMRSPPPPPLPLLLVTCSHPPVPPFPTPTHRQALRGGPLQSTISIAQRTAVPRLLDRVAPPSPAATPQAPPRGRSVMSSLLPNARTRPPRLNHA